MKTTSTLIPCPIAIGAVEFGSRPAISDGEKTWSYADLDRVVGSRAAELKAHAGQRIALQSWNSVDLVAALCAAWRLGCLI
ncbi:AMP-binding protein, partial [bacterium]|nr:AMP-binding protein [bacterium]